MRILISNKYYYPRGGSDIYAIELEKLLRRNGHEVAFFAMQHPLNLETEYLKYFPSEIDVNNRDFRTLPRAIIRPFGSKEVRVKFTSVLREFKPDIVHLNNIHSQLSPILAIIAKKMRIPVVWTLHDHKLLCPRYDCMRDEMPCELCFTNKFNVIRYNCMKNSKFASLIAFLEAKVWNRRVLSRATNIFICPSEFLLKNMVKGGFREDQIKVLHNFILEEKLSGVFHERGNYYCYVGRLSKEKGIETLLKAAISLPQFELKIAGTGPIETFLKNKYNASHIKFLGFRDWDDLKTIMGKSKFTVVPSECYENNPLSILESLCTGTPVLGARIGGISELIETGVNGFTFEPGNIVDLKKQILHLNQTSSDLNYNEIAGNARAKFTSGRYYESLIEVYRNSMH